MVFPPIFFSRINCAVSLDHVEKTVTNMITRNSYKLTEIAKNVDSLVISYSVQNYSLFYHNSFLPNVSIRYFSNQGKSNQIDIWFELKKPTRYLIVIYCILAIIFEIAMIMFVISGHMLLSPVVFLPLVLFLFSYVLSFIGLRQSSKIALRMILEAFSPELQTATVLKYCNIISTQRK